MKKVILTVAAIFAFGFANAQEVKETTGGNGFASGDIFMSGSVGVSSTSTDDVKSNTFTIAPKLGFFVSDNIAIGGKLGFVSTKSEDGVTPDDKTTTLEVGAFGRYYATPGADFSFFAELGANYTTSTVDDGIGEDAKVNGFNLGIAPGVSYFISNNFALEASIGVLRYGTTKPDADNAESTDKVDFGLNLSDISLGLVYKF